MAWNVEDLQQRAGLGAGVTSAVGSNASIDLREDILDANELSPANPESIAKAKALQQEHPDYRDNVEKWQKYLNLYTSEDISQYIFRHFRESDDKWSQRVERGYFYNYVKSVVELFTAFLFHHPADRVPGDEFAEEFEEVYKDFDRAGTGVVTFFQEVCNYAQVEGQVGILVDLPRLESEPRNEAERKEANLRPYCSMIHSPHILDWEVDQHGNFLWVKIEVFRPQERSWDAPASESVRHFQIWTTQTWEEWRLDKEDHESGDGLKATLVDSKEHRLGIVPFVVARLEKSMHSWFGCSAVKDIADINIAILNWSSLGDEEIYERCLNVLAMEAADDGSSVSLGNANVLEFPPGTQHVPFYLEPGATPLERIQAWINHGKDEIRRLAKINLSAGLGDVRQASSGIAKAFSFIETNQSLAAKALNMEQVERRVHEVMARYMGGTFEGSIGYPREFGVEDWLMLYQELQQARTTLTSETAIKELEKSFTEKLFSRQPMKLRQKIAREIDASDGENGASFGSSFGMTPIGKQVNGLNQGESDAEETPNQAEPGQSN